MPGKKKAVKKSVKKRMGGGMMGPKKKMARGGAVKKRGGGMMGPKKKLAKGGALQKARARKPSGRLNVDDVKRAMPTGRSAAAIKASMKGVSTPGSKIMAKIKKGKGNPAGKDLSIKGKITALLRAAPATGKLGSKGLKKGIGRLMKRKGKK